MLIYDKKNIIFLLQKLCLFEKKYSYLYSRRERKQEDTQKRLF
jgi:hypothetical protein